MMMMMMKTRKSLFAFILLILSTILLMKPTLSQTVPVTAIAPNATSGVGAQVCPVCFNCKETPCTHYASCLNNECLCPDGWGGPLCEQPTCNSTNLDPSRRSVRSEVTNQCECDDGFVGENCNVCTRDDVCKGGSTAPLGSSYVCNQLNTVWQAGGMNCGVQEPALKSIYNGTSSAYISRNITDGTTLASLWYNALEQFYCRATECEQEIVNDEYIWKCADVKCDCVKDSTFCGGPGVVVDLSPVMPQISGSLEIKFDSETSETGTLTFEALLDLFPAGLTLGPCVAGECVDPSYKVYLTSSNSGLLSPSAIGGITFASALALLILGGLLFAKFSQLRLQHAPKPIPIPGAQLQFRNIDYRVGYKEILSDVTGSASPGRVMAILGPSGAGKSTFLDILAGKSKSGKLSGDILVNGRKMNPRKFRAISGYVDQEDLLVSTLTVRETLLFSANLRMPESVSAIEKERIVDKTIQDLGLSHIKDSRIGGGGIRGISGGEKRRVSIGVELVQSPSVLFLDEPTSGLDSYNAMMVVKTLASLAHENGKTIIFTIHQPRSDVYQMFDDVLLLAKGEVMYMGEAKEAADVMASRGTPCPHGYNIADHLLDLAVYKGLEIEGAVSATPGIAHAAPQTELKNRKSQLMKIIPMIGSKDDPNDATTNHNNSEDSKSDTVSASESDPSSTAHLTGQTGTDTFTVSFLTQLTQLMLRSWKILIRQPSLLWAHNIISIVLGLFVGFLYFQSNNTVAGFQNHIGSAFFILALIGFSSLSAIGQFSQERLLFLRERSNGFYGPVPFFISKVLFDMIPLRLIPAGLLGTIAFFLIGYAQLNDAFAKFLVVIFLFSAQCGLFCLAIASAISDFGTATLVASISILFQMLMAGFLINSTQIPVALRWIQYLSLYKYTYEAMVVNDAANMRIVDNIQGIEVNIPASIILRQFGFDINSYWRNFIISIGIFVLLMVIVLMLVVFKLKERR